MDEVVTPGGAGDVAETHPAWLHALFGFQALGWIGQAVLTFFFLVFASAFPERVAEIAFLVFQLLLAVCLVTLFILGSVRPMTRGPRARFATTQALAALLTTTPFAVLMVASAIHHGGDGPAGTLAGNVAFSLSLLIVALSTLIGARSARKPLVLASGTIAFLWTLLGSCFFLGAGVGMAGISA